MPSKPRLGQNFLRDSQAIQRIANALGDLTSETVVEIGPGQGAITRALASRAAQVLAIELDPNLAAHLGNQFSQDRVTVIQADVLGFDFQRSLPRRPEDAWWSPGICLTTSLHRFC